MLPPKTTMPRYGALDKSGTGYRLSNRLEGWKGARFAFCAWPLLLFSLLEPAHETEKSLIFEQFKFVLTKTDLLTKITNFSNLTDFSNLKKER